MIEQFSRAANRGVTGDSLSHMEQNSAREGRQSPNQALANSNDELRLRAQMLKEALADAVCARDYADALVEAIAHPLLVLDDELRVIRVNRAFRELFGADSASTFQQSLFLLGEGEWNVPPLRESMIALLRVETEVRAYEVTADFAKIGKKTMRLVARRLAWQDRAQIMLTFEDVTERKAKLVHLAEADRQKDDFLAILAHELRNPLAAISGSLQVWQHQGASQVMKAAAFSTVERQLRLQGRLVDDLLDVSRISRGIVVLHPEQVDLVRMIQQVLDSLKSQSSARTHTISVTLPRDPMLFNGDPMRLAQVICNLIGNSIKYTPCGGMITINLWQEKDEAIFSVVDDGIGITAEVLPRVFEPFFQADPSIDRSSGGLGIGLSLVKCLAELHGGRVKAESEGLGKGSRFELRLPLTSAEGLVEEPEPVGCGAASFGRATKSARVLVVDDNPDASFGLSVLLELEGFEVKVVVDGPSAIRDVVAFKPNAVLLDIGLPGMNGFEVCRRIRELPGQDALLVIGLSGYGGEDATRQARVAGMDFSLMKPADIDALLAKLRAK